MKLSREFMQLRSLFLAPAEDTSISLEQAEAIGMLSSSTLLSVLLLHFHRSATGAPLGRKAFTALLPTLVLSDEAVERVCDTYDLRPVEAAMIHRLVAAVPPDLFAPRLIVSRDEIDVMGPRVFVEMLYRIYLDRAPDPEGYDNHVAAIESGHHSPEAVAEGFANSEEMRIRPTGRTLIILPADTSAGAVPDAALLEALRRQQIHEIVRLYEFALLLDAVFDAGSAVRAALTKSTHPVV